MVTNREFFHPLTFDFLCETAQLGSVPYPLDIDTHGSTEDERARLRRQAHRELQARALIDERGTPHPPLLNSLQLLKRASLSVDSVHADSANPGAPSTTTILAASDGNRGVLAVHNADGVWLQDVSSTEITTAVVRSLPSNVRGSLASITIPWHDAVQIDAEKTVDSFSAKRTPAMERGMNEREMYRVLISQPRIRGGQLAVNSRDSHGRKRRSAILAWFDTPTGRYLSSVQERGATQRWLTIAPADAQTLSVRLREQARVLVSVN